MGKTRYIFFLLLILVNSAVSCKQAALPGGSSDAGFNKDTCVQSHDNITYNWYHDAVFYHIWVKSFHDSKDKDQIGDIRGIIEKLDYLNDGNPHTHHDLGVNAIWLSPIFECGLKSKDPSANMHGYDTTDYYAINSILGNKQDIRRLLREAHKRGIKVIFDFVPNHTSTEHQWFKNAVQKGKKRDWYIWDDAPSTSWYGAWGGGGWSSVWKKLNHAYFYTVFQTDTLADLNYNNSDVREEMKRVVRYWVQFGFDGIRVDAARYLYEDGINRHADSEKTHEYFKDLRASLHRYPKKKLMLAEAWADKGIIQQYYGDGDDEFDMCFDFPFAYIIPEVINHKKIDLLHQLYLYEQKFYPSGYCSATFLSNHDNVTSRPYTEYAGNGKKCVLAATLNILSAGTPFIYYGNEIGMKGESGKDINLRKCMNWETVATQQKDKDSMLSWYKYLIQARNTYSALRRGVYIPLVTLDAEVLAYLRVYKGQYIAVILNLSPAEKENIILDFSETGAREKAVSPILGILQGEHTLTGDNNLLIKKMAGYSPLILYIGKKKQPHIYGNSQRIKGGAANVVTHAVEYKKMYIRGTMNNWGGSTPMKKIAPHIWSIILKLADGRYEYKFEVGGQKIWQTNWGDNDHDKQADLEGDNIILNVYTKDYYIFNFNDRTLKYDVKRK